ncbi:MAG: hypothetical protein K0R73_1477 [Candidatus Midichloriaceae bacterium]|nr:hypothetical protein [Candidatus Midichloriaceae bacterium]
MNPSNIFLKEKRWPGGQKGLRINAHEREQTFLSQRLTDCVSGRRIIDLFYSSGICLCVVMMSGSMKDHDEKIVNCIKAKYLNQIAKKKDVHFFLGTNKYWHIRKSKNPLMIIGVFYPPLL